LWIVYRDCDDHNRRTLRDRPCDWSRIWLFCGIRGAPALPYRGGISASGAGMDDLSAELGRICHPSAPVTVACPSYHRRRRVGRRDVLATPPAAAEGGASPGRTRARQLMIRFPQLPWLGILAVAISRILFRSHAPYDIDSVNFVLAMQRFDPSVHQPHPPG